MPPPDRQRVFGGRLAAVMFTDDGCRQSAPAIAPVDQPIGASNHQSGRPSEDGAEQGPSWGH